MDKVTYASREVIFREGEYQKWMFSICEGAVDIYSAYGTEDEKRLVTLTVGQFFGEIGMIAMLPRTATAVAAEGTVLERITYEELEQHLKNNPGNIRQIMHNVSGRIRELTDDLSRVNSSVNELLGRKESLGARVGESLQKLLASLKEKAGIGEIIAASGEKEVPAGELKPMVKYRSGQVIFRAGDAADCFYEIYSGSVGIYADHKTPNEKLLSRLQAGDAFGEMGVLDGMPRSATAVCLEPCTLQAVGKDQFLLYFTAKPMKILQQLQKMCMQLRSLSAEYLRVSKKLEELAAQSGADFDEEDTYAQLREEFCDHSFRADWMNY